ncbi:MAG TPA: anaerobic dehydrogenase [Phycisphaerales bacterium]|nr:MAG: hypothetical protein A2Y13_01245 [Planctomycetes bacterium GWC2_45_44]HBG77502.1 anaerobic dehydrogenase [Phycisphaerales bacterium]HBR19110.1 anaerobic dehydrogenase [Phycisphaerales bacterium]
MAKAVPVKNDKDELAGYMIFCPACECGHLFYTNHSNPKCNWIFDGNTEKPTFSPSMLVHQSACQPRCHSFVRNGQIQFLSDCTHKMAGQTVELPEI